MSISSFWTQIVKRKRTRSGTSRRRPSKPQMSTEPPVTVQAPATQQALLLHGIRQPYQVTASHPVPETKEDEEILVRTHVIGLNPIDWKAPDFNFGIPVLPYISGRELVGEVVKLPKVNSRLKLGDKVMVISTDYRDLRKAAYQEYVVASDYNVVKLPEKLSNEEGATIGVAFVAAVLALGVCMGVDFSNVLDGPNLLQLVKEIQREQLPADIQSECLDGIRKDETAKPGDWIAIWGGSSTSANLTTQLARLAGLRVITVVDKCKHGLWLSNHTTLRPDLLVDSHDPERAIAIIRGATKGSLRFGIDTRGKDTAKALFDALGPLDKASREGSVPSPPPTPPAELELRSHLVGLSGLPKPEAQNEVALHTVPIKLFHEVPGIGYALVQWLERLLEKGLIVAPEIVSIEEGLSGVNPALDRMRKGEISGGKAVVRLN